MFHYCFAFIKHNIGLSSGDLFSIAYFRTLFLIVVFLSSSNFISQIRHSSVFPFANGKTPKLIDLK